MKKKVFDASVLGNRFAREGNYISVKQTGIISFSADLSKELGKTIQIVQDEARPKDWYIEPTKSSSGIPVKPLKDTNRVCIQASFIARALLESLGLKESTYEFTVSSDSSDGMFAILSSTAAPVVRGGAKPRIKIQRKINLLQLHEN